MKNVAMIVVLIASLYLFPASSSSERQSTSAVNLLDSKVKSFDLENGSIIDAVKQLKYDSRQIPINFTLEVAAYRDEPSKNLSISIRDTTVRKIIEQIVIHDPRYTYQKVDSHLVHILPISALHDQRDLLNVMVKHLKIEGVPYDAFLKDPPNFIPDLEGEILLRSKSGGYIGGGLLGLGGPTVNLTVQNITVRELLNRIAEETLKLPPSESAPIGWIYTFQLDDSLPLGGRPKWDIF